jgi:hypothetical protein
MADDATISISATLLPDEISRVISGSMTVSPDDADDKWYYKLTSCTATSTDLIAGAFLDYTAVDDDTAPIAIASGDKVKFLFVQVQSSDDGIYLCFDGGTAANDLVDGVFVGPNQTWFGQLPNTTVANLHAISSDIAGTGGAVANVIVAALIEDVSA